MQRAPPERVRTFIRILQARDRELGGEGFVTDYIDLLVHGEVYEPAPDVFVGAHKGVLGVVLPKGSERYAVRVIRVLKELVVKYGRLRSIVHHRNVPSIMATRRCGGILLGVTKDGYFHYEWTAEGFKYGKAKRAEATGSQAYKQCSGTNSSAEQCASEKVPGNIAATV